MSTDIATLGLAVDSRPVSQAAVDLADLTQAAIEVEQRTREAARGARDFTTSAGTTGRQAQLAAADMERLAQSTRNTAEQTSSASERVNRVTQSTRDLLGPVQQAAAELERLGFNTENAGDQTERATAGVEQLGQRTQQAGDRVRRASDDLDRFGDNVQEAGNRTRTTARATDVLRQAVSMAARAYAAWQVASHVKDMAMLAARYETMGVVMRVAGNNAGYTQAQMKELEKTLQSTGISMLQARNTITQLSTANIDLAKAQELARNAQNLAVVANINSSEALERMIQGIKSGEQEVLQTMGMNVSWEASYKALAQQLGINADKLTEQQKTIARTNVVLKEGTKFNGIYEESMSTAGKQISSMSRYIEDLKVKAGQVFLPVLSQQVADLTKALKEANKELDRQGGKDSAMEKFGNAALEAYKKISKGGMAAFQTVAATSVGIYESFKNSAEGIKALFSGDWAGFKDAQQRSAQTLADLRREGIAFRNGLYASQRDEPGWVNGRPPDAAGMMVNRENRAKGDMRASMIAAGNSQDKEAQRMAAGKAAREEAEANEKAAAALEEASKARKKSEEQYKDLIATINEKIAADQLEASTSGRLTDAEKYKAEMLGKVDSGVLKLTATERARLVQKLDEAIVAENLRLAMEKQAEADAAVLERDKKAIETLEEKVKGMREELANYGLSTQAINRNTIAKLEAQIATGDLSDIETASRQAQIRLLQEQIQLQTDLDSVEAGAKRAEERKVQMEKNAQEQIESAKATVASIDRTFHDGFIAMMDRGSGSWKSWTRSLVATFKSTVADELYKMFIKPIVVKLVGSYMGVSSDGLASTALSALSGGGGVGGDGGGLGNLSSLYNAGKTIYSGFSSGFSSGLASGIGGYITQFGTTFGSTAATAFGTGMSTPGAAAVMGELASGAAGASSGTAAAGSAAAGASAGAYAIPIAGWIMAGMAMSNSLYKQGWDTHNGTIKDPLQLGGGIRLFDNALRGIGLNNSTANIFSGQATFARLFGRKAPKIEQQGVEGTITASGFAGQNYANILEKGGVFRSDKRYTQTASLTKEQDLGLDSTVQAMIQAVKGFGAALGLETTTIDGYSKAIKLELTDDAAKNQEIIAKMFGEMGDELSLRLMPTVTTFSKAGETVSATLQRLAGDFMATNQIAMVLGQTAEGMFGGKSIESTLARERIIELMGGLDNFGQAASVYAQNFMTEAERLAPVQKAVTEALAGLGLQGITTREQFKAVVDGLMSSGATATEEGAKMFAGLMSISGAFAQVTASAEDAEGSLQSTTDALLSARSALEESYYRESEAIQASLGQMKDWSKSLRGLFNSQLLGSLSTLTPMEQYAEARKQFQETAAAAKAGDKDAMGNYASAEAAFLSASQRVFASSSRYVSDFNEAQSVTAGLRELVDGQITAAERQQQALDASVKGLISIESAVLSVRDAILGVNQAEQNAVTSAYTAAGASAPDSGTMAYWIEQLRKGVSVEDVRAEIKAAQERTSSASSATIEATVTKIVQPLLDRLTNIATGLEGLRDDQNQQTGDTISAIASLAEPGEEEYRAPKGNYINLKNDYQ